MFLKLSLLGAAIVPLALGCTPASSTAPASAHAPPPVTAPAPAPASDDAAVPARDERPKVIVGGGTIDATACEKAGGECTAVGSCNDGNGSIGEPSCGVGYMVCCMKGCGPETFSCCAGGASFRPQCTGGKLECRDGQQRCAP